MKKLLTAVLASAAILSVCALAGCADDEREQSDGKIEHGYSMCYAFTAESSTMTIDENSSMKDYMDALKAKNMLAFEGSDGDYGYFITSVFGVGSVTVSSTANSYSGYDWYVYTTVTSVDGVIYSDDKATFDYDGITLYKASYGVSGLPCIEGQTYALVYEYSSMTW